MPPTTITNNRATDSYVNSAIAYVSGSTLFGQSTWNSMVEQMKSDQAANIAAYDAPEAVKAGYNATYSTQVDTLFPTQIGPIELLFALSFGGVQVQAALQHPCREVASKLALQTHSTHPRSTRHTSPTRST